MSKGELLQIEKTKNTHEVIQFVIEYSGEILSILNEFPDSEYKESLATMVNYEMERKK